jgi:RHS repeat-associated protein
VKSIFNGNITTYFVGNHYEVTGSTITKYYYAGGQRIAMRTNGTLRYILGDHLGSTSLTTDANGQNPTQIYYKAWGEMRYSSGNTPTKYQYTGQFSYESDFGLYFYNARWYDSALGRFAQADTIVPQSQGVQAWDRYAYTNNNPVLYTDPSGHGVDCGIGMGCVKDYSGAKTLQNFLDIGWNERKRWLTEFASQRKLGDIPLVVVGKAGPTFSRSKETHQQTITI